MGADLIVNVIWPSYHAATSRHGSWDMGLLEDLFDGQLWSPVRGHLYLHRNTFEETPEDISGAVVVLPGQHHAGDIERLNADLKRFSWVLMILVGDEESLFSIEAVQHPNLKWWIQSRRTVLMDSDHRFIPWGYPQGTREFMQQNRTAEKLFEWYFSGQMNHRRRQQCAATLSRLNNGKLNETGGFTQGYERMGYLDLFTKSKTAPCPAGCVTPDSFRVWEALEAGCVPIVDGMSPRPEVCPTQFWWEKLLGTSVGFPVINDWSDSPGIIRRENADWPESSNRVFSWWQGYKRELAYRLRDDINALSGVA